MKMIDRIKKVSVPVASAFAAFGASASVALAEPTGFTIPTLPMDDYYSLMTAVLAGLAALWVGRKIIKTTNKS